MDNNQYDRVSLTDWRLRTVLDAQYETRVPGFVRWKKLVAAVVAPHIAAAKVLAQRLIPFTGPRSVTVMCQYRL